MTLFYVAIGFLFGAFIKAALCAGKIIDLISEVEYWRFIAEDGQKEKRPPV